jgi:hypothetical protein
MEPHKISEKASVTEFTLLPPNKTLLIFQQKKLKTSNKLINRKESNLSNTTKSKELLFVRKAAVSHLSLEVLVKII